MRLSGPPPGRNDNIKLLKRALSDHYNCSDFVNVSKFERATSEVVERIVNSNNANMLPCFITSKYYTTLSQFNMLLR